MLVKGFFIILRICVLDVNRDNLLNFKSFYDVIFDM